MTATPIDTLTWYNGNMTTQTENEIRKIQLEIIINSGFWEVLNLYYRVVRTYKHWNHLFLPYTYGMPYETKEILKREKKFKSTLHYINGAEGQNQMVHETRLMLLEWIVSRLINLGEQPMKKRIPPTSIPYMLQRLDSPECAALITQLPNTDPDWKANINKFMSTFKNDYLKLKKLRNTLEHQHTGLYVHGSSTQQKIREFDVGELDDMLRLMGGILLEVDIRCLGEYQDITLPNMDIYWEHWKRGRISGGVWWYEEEFFMNAIRKMNSDSTTLSKLINEV